MFVLIHTTPLSSTQMVQPVVRWADLPCGPRGPDQQPLAPPRGAPAHPRHPPSRLRQSSSAPIARRSPTSPAPTAAPPQAAGWSTAPPHHLLLHPSTEAAVATLHRPPIWKCPHPPLTAGRSPSHRPPTEATPLPILWSRHHLPADRQREALQLLHLRLPTDRTHRAASPTGRPTWTGLRSYHSGTTPCTKNTHLEAAAKDAAMLRPHPLHRLHPPSRAADHHHQPESHLDAEQVKPSALWTHTAPL